jgi:hypothetical protein
MGLETSLLPVELCLVLSMIIFLFMTKENPLTLAAITTCSTQFLYGLE